MCHLNNLTCDMREVRNKKKLMFLSKFLYQIIEFAHRVLLHLFNFVKLSAHFCNDLITSIYFTCLCPFNLLAFFVQQNILCFFFWKDKKCIEDAFIFDVFCIFFLWNHEILIHFNIYIFLVLGRDLCAFKTYLGMNKNVK